MKLFSSSVQNTLLHALLAFKVSIKKSAVLPLYVICFFSITAFNSLSLFSVFVLMVICYGEVLLWSSLFGVLEDSYT
jgi:hypothetical protein